MNYYYRFTYKGRRASARVKFDDMLTAINYMMNDIEKEPTHVNASVTDEDNKSVCIASTVR